MVLLISDGWDRGDPEVLRDEIARLQRSCHRLIWLNPLIGTADYAPLTRGLQAALPFVDDFLPARTLTDLARPGATLERDLDATHMDITGSYTFAAPPDRVWALLMDPAVISSCIPGCERFEPDGEDRYKAALTVGMAAITGTYDGTVVITDKVAADVVSSDGRRPGAAGFVKGSADDHAARRRRRRPIVDVTGTVQTGGPIARLGQRLIGGVAKMMQDRFFACLQSKLVDELPDLAQDARAYALPSQRAPREHRDHRRRYSALAWMSALTSLDVRRRRACAPPSMVASESGLPASACSTLVRRDARASSAPVSPTRAD